MVTNDRARLSARALGAVRRRVAVDARALAAFRIALGAILLVDLARRSLDLVAFYTDAGVVPRSVLATQSPTFGAFSLHALSGSALWQALLFLGAGLVAVALLVGYRTRFATALSLVLLLSLHVRNPAILNGGDSLLRHLLLWGVFVPLGRRWSVDAIHRDASPPVPESRDGQDRADTVASIATAGLLAQVVFVYATNAILKLRGDAWPGGDAVEQVMAMTRYSTALGDALLAVPALLELGTYLWLGLLVASPLLLLSRGRLRTLLAGAIAAVHLGMAVFMELGLFPFVSIAGLVPFVGPVVWDRLPSAGTRTVRRLAGLLPAGPTLPAWGWLRPIRTGMGTALPAVILAVLLVVNTASVGYVSLPEGAPAALEDKSWSMFAPAPPGDDGWYVFAGRLDAGRQVDARTGGSLSRDRPPDVDETYPNNRWQALLYRLRDSPEAHLQRPLAEYHCRRFDRDHAGDLAAVTIEYHPYDVRDGTRGETVTLGEFDCPAAG